MLEYLFKSKNNTYFLKTILVFIIIILHSLLEIALGYLFMIYLNRVTGDNNYSLHILAYIGIGFVILQFVVSFIYVYSTNFLIKKIRKELTLDVLSSIYKRNLKYLKEENNESSNINLITNELSSLFDNYYFIIIKILSVGVSFILAIYYITKLNIIYIIPLLFTIMVMIIMVKISKNRVNSKWMLTMEKLNIIIRKIKNYTKNIVIIKSFSYNNEIHNDFQKNYSEYNNSLTSYSNINGLFERINNLLATTLFILIYLVSIYLSINNQITAGEIVFVIQITNIILAPLFMLGWFINSINSTKGIRQKVKNILNYNIPEGEDVKLNEIRVENLSFGYVENKVILKDISFTARKGDIIAIIGESGTGKSTLLKILNKQLDNYKGKILIDNIELNKISEKSYFSSLKLLTQMPTYFENTIKNNIIMNNKYDEDKFNKYIKLLRLETMLERLKDREDTILDSEKTNVSIGELQRIALARLLYSGCKYLLLDEPFASLDNYNQQIIENALLELDDTCIIIVSHKFSDKFIENCTKLINL